MITAIVLAAGISKRMGAINKMHYDINGVTVLCRTLMALQASRVDNILVVLGFEASRTSKMISKCLDHVRLIENPSFQLGMSTSIATGAQQLRQENGCLICLGDMPYITAEEYDLLLETFQKSGRSDMIVVPRYEGSSGNPILFGKSFFNDLRNMEVGDRGAKRIVNNSQANLLYVDMPTNHVLLDIDQPLDSDEWQ